MRIGFIKSLTCTVSFLLAYFTLVRAQGDYLSYGTNWNYEYNDCLWYNIYTTHTSQEGTLVLDTANLCRVKQNRIRTVSVYRFANWEDTTLFHYIVYDTNGFVVNWTNTGNNSMSRSNICQPHDSIEKADRRTVLRGDKTKRVWIRNEAGYVTEYKYFNRGGLWHRFITALISQNDHKIKYTYSEDGRTVTQDDIPKRYFSVFRRWTHDPEFRWVFVFDENANLISEHHYDLRGEVPALNYSYLYKYEYYTTE